MATIVNDTPWYYYIICLAAGILYAYLLYSKNAKADLPSFLKKVLFFIRFIAITLICLFLCKLLIKHIYNENQEPIVLLAIDNSSSMLHSKDSSRQRVELLKAINTINEKLSDKYSTRMDLFGSSARSNSLPDFKDNETDLGEFLLTVKNNYEGQNVGAMVIVSDGIYNKGANPSFLGKDIHFPIYTIGVGDTTQINDLVIKRINHNQIAYKGNQFLVEVQIEAYKMNGESSRLSIIHDGKTLTEKTISISGNEYFTSETIALDASEVGLVNYQVKIEPLTDEINKKNNYAQFNIDIIENRDKILIVNRRPHPDISALVESISTFKNYSVDQTSYDAINPLLQSYEVIVFHQPIPSDKKYIDECVLKKIPYLIIDPDYKLELPFYQFSGFINKYNDSECELNNSFAQFNLTEETKKMISVFPAVKTCFGKYIPKTGSNVLLKQKVNNISTNDPLLIFREEDGEKSGCFIGDGLWRWRIRNFEEKENFTAFDEIINKTIQYLTIKNDKSLFRVYHEKVFNENDPVEFSAEVYDKTYQPVNDKDILLTMTDASGLKFNYTFNKSMNGYRLLIGKLTPGNYSYEAQVKLDGELLTKKGLLSIQKVDNEIIQTVANHQLLYKLSSESGGQFYTLDNYSQMIDHILANETIKTITYSTKQTNDLINLKWLFFVILILLAAEWFFRKFYGQI